MAKEIEVFTASELQTFKDCPQKWYWIYKRGLHPLPTANQLMGSAVHLGIAMKFQGQENWREEIDILFRKEAPVASEIGDLYLKKEIAKILVEKFPIQKFRGQVIPEVKFEELIKRPGKVSGLKLKRIAGKVDGILIDHEGKNWLVEHKTTALQASDLIPRLVIDSQVLIYLAFFPLELSGSVLSVIQKPRLRLKKNELPDEFLERIRLDVDESNFVLEFNFVDRDLVEKTRREVADLIKIISDCSRKNIFWKNTSRCSLWGGCPFYQLCSSGQEDEDYMRQRFQVFETKHPELEEKIKEEEEVPF